MFVIEWHEFGIVASFQHLEGDIEICLRPWYNRFTSSNSTNGWCDMGKSKKQKNYDSCISPGKSYLYKTRKSLFALSVSAFIINVGIIAVFDESMRKSAVIAILLSAIFFVVQFIDNRKTHWGWLYIILLSTLFLLFSAIFAFATELLFMRYIWVIEFVFFCGLFVQLLRRKKGWFSAIEIKPVRQIPIY